jgi:ferredoxin
LRVLVDRDLCEANGVCTMVAASVFVIDDADRLHILAEEVPADAEQDVLAAVQDCPRSAIKVR